MDRLPFAIFGFHLLVPLASSRPDRFTYQPVRISATTSIANNPPCDLPRDIASPNSPNPSTAF
jgi:hypothetical protein